jgi:hypothetical protein
VTGLGSRLPWDGRRAPGTLHIGIPGDVTAEFPALTRPEAARRVRGLARKPARVVLHMRWAFLADGQAWADALGVPVVIPLAELDEDFVPWMRDDAGRRWSPITRALEYSPTPPGGAAAAPAIYYESTLGWIQPGLLTRVRTGVYTLAAHEGAAEHTVVVTRSGLYIHPGPTTENDLWRAAVAVGTSNNGLVLQTHPGADPVQIAAVRAGLNVRPLGKITERHLTIPEPVVGPLPAPGATAPLPAGSPRRRPRTAAG